jgi:hypothetical protein
MREYRINAIDSDKTLEKAQKLAQRCTKKGLTGGYRVSIESRFEFENGVGKKYKVLVVEGEPVKYEGWQFVAVAEFIGGQTITKASAGGREVKPSEVRVGYCDHCQKIRSRSKVIFVQNEEGKLSQVGSSCVKDFLGWEFNASFLPTEDIFEEEYGSYSGGGYAGFSTKSVLAYAITQVEKVGYIPSGTGLSTKSLVWAKLGGGYHAEQEWKKSVGAEPGIAEFNKAQELIEYAKTFAGDSSYAENLRACAALEYQSEKTIGIMVSVIKAKEKADAQVVLSQEKVEFKKVQYAETGSKVEVEVTVANSATFESSYGWTTIYTFVSGDYQFKWFSSSGINVEIGDKVTIKGTVKGSDEYKESFSTVLTRCKVVEKAA